MSVKQLLSFTLFLFQTFVIYRKKYLERFKNTFVFTNPLFKEWFLYTNEMKKKQASKEASTNVVDTVADDGEDDDGQADGQVVETSEMQGTSFGYGQSPQQLIIVY